MQGINMAYFQNIFLSHAMSNLLPKQYPLTDVLLCVYMCSFWKRIFKVDNLGLLHFLQLQLYPQYKCYTNIHTHTQACTFLSTEVSICNKSTQGNESCIVCPQ